MKKLILPFFLLVLCACDKNEEIDENDSNSSQLIKGTGNFIFNQYAPLADKAVPVYYHVPEGINSFTPILFVFHGGSRDAKESRDKLIAKADQRRIIIMAPEFTEEDYPGGDAYNLGNVFVDGDNPSPSTLNEEAIWTFSIVEPLFDYAKILTANSNGFYYSFGFSAGSQFLHRFNLFKPNNRTTKIVAAASGWYTMPDFQSDFPYGVKVAPVNQADLNAFFEKEMTVLVGQNDNDPNAPSLRRNAIVDLQGDNRYDRALYFVSESGIIANNSNTPFIWQSQILPNVAHEFTPLAEYAMDNIFSN